MSMSVFESVLADALLLREAHEKAYNDKKAAEREHLLKLTQASDLMTSRYRFASMKGYHGFDLNDADLKKEIVRLGGIV